MDCKLQSISKTVDQTTMFATPKDLAHFASGAFDEVLQRSPPPLLATGPNKHTQQNAFLSPWEYRFAYLSVFGSMPSEADLQLAFSSGNDLLPFDEEGIPRATACHTAMPPRSLADEKRAYVDLVSSQRPSPELMTKDRFVRRMHDKYVAMYGQFGVAAKAGRRVPLLWSVFDSVDTTAKGYFTLDDLSSAVRRVAGLEEDPVTFDRLAPTCKEMFAAADDDFDGRVYFDRFEWITSQIE